MQSTILYLVALVLAIVSLAAADKKSWLAAGVALGLAFSCGFWGVFLCLMTGH